MAIKNNIELEIWIILLIAEFVFFQVDNFIYVLIYRCIEGNFGPGNYGSPSDTRSAVTQRVSFQPGGLVFKVRRSAQGRPSQTNTFSAILANHSTIHVDHDVSTLRIISKTRGVRENKFPGVAVAQGIDKLERDVLQDVEPRVQPEGSGKACR